MTQIYRGEQFRISWSPEKVRQDPPSSAFFGTTYCTNIFGVFSSSTLPDPTYEWQPVWMFGNESKRNWSKIYPGRVTHTGAIPDIWLLDAKSLRLPFGTVRSYGTTVGTKGNSSISTHVTLVGDTHIHLTADTNFATLDYVRIGTAGTSTVEYRQITGGPASPWTVAALTYAHALLEEVVEVNDILSTVGAAGDDHIHVTTVADFAPSVYVCIGEGSSACEIRQILSSWGGANPVTLDYPLSYAHPITGANTGVDIHSIVSSAPNYWHHTIYESTDLSPFSIHATYYKSDESTGLMRRFYGGKVQRATIHAAEGEELRFSLDDMIFRDVGFMSPDTNAVNVSKYDATIAAPTLTFPTYQRYLFSQGSLSYFGTEFARIRRFTMDITNNLEPRYYVANNVSSGQIPYEIREGRREYIIGTTVDITDDTFFMHLLNQGMESIAAVPGAQSFMGFMVRLVFTRGTNDTITIDFPATYVPSTGLDAQGCFLRRAPHNIIEAPIISVDLDIIARSCRIYISDPNYYIYP